MALAAFLLAPLVAMGHAGLVRSDPGRRAVVSSPPEQIRLCFNEKVEPKFSSVSLFGNDGRAVEIGAPASDPQDLRCLTIPVSAVMKRGTYTVRYKVLSVDGHIVENGFKFSLKP